ncbi:unnamed protein product, partial [Phaeothamnion confervicola]
MRRPVFPFLLVLWRCIVIVGGNTTIGSILDSLVGQQKASLCLGFIPGAGYPEGFGDSIGVYAYLLDYVLENNATFTFTSLQPSGHGTGDEFADMFGPVDLTAEDLERPEDLPAVIRYAASCQWHTECDQREVAELVVGSARQERRLPEATSEPKTSSYDGRGNRRRRRRNRRGDCRRRLQGGDDGPEFQVDDEVANPGGQQPAAPKDTALPSYLPPSSPASPPPSLPSSPPPSPSPNPSPPLPPLPSLPLSPPPLQPVLDFTKCTSGVVLMESGDKSYWADHVHNTGA